MSWRILMAVTKLFLDHKWSINITQCLLTQHINSYRKCHMSHFPTQSYNKSPTDMFLL